MSQVKTNQPKAKPTVSKMQNYNGVLLFDKMSYMLLGVCIVLVAIGFLLMSGGKSPNPNEFHPETLYSFQRVTLAPLVILIGFGIGIYAIVRKHSEA